MDEKMKAMVDAIRADKVVGIGSCSSIDECYDDQELAERIVEWGAKTPRGAVTAARKSEKLWREKEADVRGWGGGDVW